jgi:hypothetical protein
MAPGSCRVSAMPASGVPASARAPPVLPPAPPVVPPADVAPPLPLPPADVAPPLPLELDGLPAQATKPASKMPSAEERPSFEEHMVATSATYTIRRVRKRFRCGDRSGKATEGTEDTETEGEEEGVWILGPKLFIRTVRHSGAGRPEGAAELTTAVVQPWATLLSATFDGGV